MRSPTLLLVPFALAACDSGTPPAPASTTQTTIATHSAPVPPAPPPTPSVIITSPMPGELAIEATKPVKIASSATIEHQVDGKWSAVPDLDLGKGYRLVERCGGAAPPACIDLAPGAPLHPAPFRGFSCSSQCNEECGKNIWLGPGSFRLVVRTCDGATIEGPMFRLPDASRAPFVTRWGLAVHVIRASAMRLEKPGAGWNATAPAAPDEIAGFKVRAGTERALEEPEITSLLERLRSPDAFDDKIVKRCAMDHLVGFRVTRRPATTGDKREEVAEIAIDFTCQKLFAVYGGERGRARRVHATHFDPSRAAFLTLSRRALVDDAEIAKLR